MTIPDAIELMLRCINVRKQFVAGTFSGWAGGTTGIIQMQQRDANTAIILWQEWRDASGLIQLATNLQAYGNLTDTEYQQIMETLQGEN